jgi:hypothetical protein
MAMRICCKILRHTEDYSRIAQHDFAAGVGLVNKKIRIVKLIAIPWIDGKFNLVLPVQGRLINWEQANLNF